MPSILRSILAVLAGCLAAFLHIALIETLSHLIYPPPPDLDPAKPETIVAYMKVIPIGAMLMILLAWAVGTFAGAWFAARLATRSRLAHGLVIGGIFLASAIGNMVMIPHPTWFWIAGLAIIPVAAYVGANTAAEARKPGPGDSELLPT